ncbi:MAG: hypothetical protein K2N05_11025 [Muribaculaceae bacterium]|nr:hypothetical protein [Muribaculaceae bacterium]
MKQKFKILFVVIFATLFIAVAPCSSSMAQSRKKSTSHRTSKATQPKGTDQNTDWIYGTWVYDGTIDYGPYMGGVQRCYCKMIITKSNLKVYYDGELAYNGSYIIRDGDIVYDQKNGSCFVAPLDFKSHRIKLGEGKWYSKVSY